MLSTQQNNQSANNSSGKHGIVTKILENFGFIDDSIFFPLSVVKGSAPVKVGDKVYFECTYAKNLPFNWNATIVQPIQQSTSGSTPAANNHHQRQTSSSSQIHQSSSAATSHHSSPMMHRNVLAAPSQSSSTQQPTPSQTSAPQQPPHSHYHHPQQQSSTNHHQQQQQHLSTQNPMYHHQTVNPGQQPTQLGTGGGGGPGGGYHGYQPQPVNHHQQTGHKQVPQQSQFGPPPSQTQQPNLYNAGTPSPGYVAPASQSGPTQSQQTQNSGPPVVPAAALAAAAFNNPTDFAKVQQAVATCTQLAAQYFTPGAGSASGTATSARQTHPESNHQTPHHPAASGQQYGNAAAASGTSNTGGIAQLQYTSTPGSAFINSQFNSQNNVKSLNSGGSNLLQHGQPTQRSSGRWDHSNDDHSHRFAQQRQPQSQPQQPQKMMDNNRGTRFSGKSRFNQEPDMYSSSINDDRFGSHGMTHGSNFIPPTSDHFRDFVPQRQDMRKDKDNRDFHDRSRDRDNKLDRDKDRNVDRERSRDRDRDRDRDRRDRDRSKRSLSPASSVASSIAGNSSKNSNLSFLPKRRYEPCNIPKTIVIKNRYNSIELRSRLHGSVHIPSDLKEIIYNAETEFDLFNMPKPIQYKIINEHKESKEKDSHSKESSKSTKSDDKSESKKSLPEKNKSNDLKSESMDTDKTEEKKENKNLKDLKTEDNSEDNTDPDTKMDVDLIKKEEEIKTVSEVNAEMKNENKNKSDNDLIESNKKENASGTQSKLASNKLTSVNKFNVKILLFSVPSLDDIYERLFGTEFASPSFISGNSGTTIKNQVSHFHKLFSLLVAKNSNDGYSLVGGKFQKELDGFLPGTKEPNLVQTAIRIVWEQTGLNLSSCRQWRVLSTFIYNRDNSLNPNEGGYEITKIYSPDIWSAIDCIYQPLKQNEANIQKDSKEDLNKSYSNELNNDKVCISLNESSEDNDNANESDVQQNSEDIIREDLVHIKDIPNNEKRKYMENVLESIQNFKVTELKNELEKFGIKISSRWKKEQLTQELQKVINESLRILDGEEDISLSQIAKKEDITIKGQDSFDEMSEDNFQNNDNNELKDSECSQKRKFDKLMDTEETSTPKNENKKSKRLNEDETQLKSSDKETELEQSPSTSNIKVKGNLSTLSLHSALNPHRFDQFELIVISEFLRDLLTIHFAHYIYSSIIYNIQLGKPIIPIGTSTLEQQQRSNTPANYVHLAFSYFDKGHCGYMLSEDLNNLLNMTGFSISKKNFNYLITSLMSLSNTTVSSSSSNEKIIYMFFQQPSMSTLIPSVPEYPFVNIFLNNHKTRLLTGNKDYSKNDTSENSCLIVERNSIQYNVDELIKQSEADQKIKVQLNDSYSNALKKIAQLEVQIQELETKQKKMSAATGRQNDELCAVKRDRDGFKTKYEQMKSFANKYCLEFNNLTKSFEKVSGGSQASNNSNNNNNNDNNDALFSTQQTTTDKNVQ